MLTIAQTPATGWPTRITVTSDRRVTPARPAVTETAKITVETAGESVVWQATRELSPAAPRQVAPITYTVEGTAATLRLVSDDGVTAVYDVVG